MKDAEQTALDQAEDGQEATTESNESKKQKTEKTEAGGYKPPIYTSSRFWYFTPFNKPSEAELKAHKEAFEAAERDKLAKEALAQSPPPPLVDPLSLDSSSSSALSANSNAEATPPKPILALHTPPSTPKASSPKAASQAEPMDLDLTNSSCTSSGELPARSSPRALVL